MSEDQAELRDWIARAIDGDLSRAERRVLFARLGADPAARQAIIDAAALENDLAAFGAAYDETAQPAPRLLPVGGPRLAERLAIWLRPLRPGIATGMLAGAAMAGLLFAVYGALLQPVEQAIDRLEVLALAFEHAMDNAQWTHEHELAGGHAVRLTLARADGAPLHLRLTATTGGKVDLVVEHHRKGHPAQTDKVGGSAVHYALLRDPRPGDEVMFRNSGSHTVKISLAADAPGAAQFEYQMARTDGEVRGKGDGAEEVARQ